MGDDALHLFERASGAVLVCFAQLGDEHEVSAEDVGWQVAMVPVVPMKKSALLPAVNGIVRGVEVEDDLVRRPVMGIEEELNEEPLQRAGIVQDLEVSPIRMERRRRRLEAIERCVPGESSPRIPRHAPALAERVRFAHRQGKHRVAAERVVIVEILVAAGERKHALGEELCERVLNESWISVICEAGCDAAKTIAQLRGFTQQKGSSVTRDVPAVEGGVNAPAAQGMKREANWGTPVAAPALLCLPVV